jgi:hypothetical protein
LSHSRLATTIIAGLFVAAACSSAATSAPVLTPAPATSPAATTPPTSSASPTAAPASPSPSPTASFVVTVALTVVDSLRVRSEPRISDDSFKEEPLLPLGTPLYVLDGPVSASGYDWYEVFPLNSQDLPQGWVASASRDGEPWIADGDFACPAMPIDIRSLAALRPGVGLACFPRVPIEVKARLIRLGGELDGGAYTPGWFGVGQLGGMLLVEPEVTRPPADPRKWFILMLDPAGRHPDVLPVGEVVKVTGVFDHPAAAACTFDSGREPVPSQDCRLMFAVKRLVVVRP